jgi:hypothetical protein
MNNKNLLIEQEMISGAESPVVVALAGGDAQAVNSVIHRLCESFGESPIDERLVGIF